MPLILCVTYGPHCTPKHPWKEGSPTLLPSQYFFLIIKGVFSCPFWGLGFRGCCKCVVKPFETMIKGYTHKMDLTWPLLTEKIMDRL